LQALLVTDIRDDFDQELNLGKRGGLSAGEALEGQDR
jgi:hypothetical protein